jgi:hypothetical protein
MDLVHLSCDGVTAELQLFSAAARAESVNVKCHVESIPGFCPAAREKLGASPD